MALLLVFLITPHFLVIWFPENAGPLAAVTASTFPWIVVLVLFLVFHDSITSFLKRLKEVSAGGITARVGQTGILITEEQVALLGQHLQELTQGNNASQQLARTYFLRFVAVSIYGSQYEFLEYLLDNGPSGQAIAVGFFSAFSSRLPKDAKVTFDEWLVYLTDNLLVYFNAETKQYAITDAGRLFIAEVRQINFDTSRFLY